MATAREALHSLMYQAVRLGSSFNAFVRDARSHGIPISRTKALSEWHEVQFEVSSWERFKALGSGEVPEATEVSALKFTQPGRYYYRLRTEAESFKGGPVVERFVTVVSEEPMTMGEIEGQLRRKWRGYDYGKEERLREMELVAAQHRSA